MKKVRRKARKLQKYTEFQKKSMWSAVLIGVIAFFVGLMAQAQTSKSFLCERDSAERGQLRINLWKDSLLSALETKDSGMIKKLIDQTYLQKAVAQCSLNSLAKADRELLKKGREHFSEGKFEKAITSYSEVSRSSDYWLEAIEEKAWSYFRLGDYAKALAQVRTLVTPVFSSAIGPEPFLLKVVAELKICDYKSMFSTLRDFRSSQKERLVAIQNLADGGDLKEINDFLSRIQSFPMDTLEVGNSQKLLPRLFYLDKKLQDIVLRLRTGQIYLEIMESSHGRQLLELAGLSQEKVQKEIAEARKSLHLRFQFLANQEADEYYRIVQKLQLAEVEVTQRVFADSGRKIEKHNSRFQTHSDDLMFLDNGEVWLDELDKFEAKVTTCDTNVRRKM